MSKTIRGALGDLYDPDSDAHHLALQQLADVLVHIGFKVWPKPSHETTLRVYPIKLRQPPLLNPGFVFSADFIPSDHHKASLLFAVLSKRFDPSVDSQLTGFASDPSCSYVPTPGLRRAGYHYYGYFVLPLSFKGEPPVDIDFQTVARPLPVVLTFLQRLRPDA